MYKKVFINKDGDLVLKGCDLLASSADLRESLCEGGEEVLGVLELSDGIFVWMCNFSDEESIQEVGEICEYIKISDIMSEISIPIEIENIVVKKENKRNIIKIREIIRKHLFMASYILGVVILHLIIYFYRFGKLIAI